MPGQGEEIRWDQPEGLPSDRAARGETADPEIAPAAIYEGGIVLERALRSGVPLEVMGPVVGLMTPKEMGDWETEEAAREHRGSRRGVHLGKDPRDLNPRDML